MSRVPQRLLIIGPSNIGDGLLVSDVVTTVRAAAPGAHLALVVGERAMALFTGDPRIQTLLDAGRFDSVLGRLKLAWALWRYQPHVVVDLRHTFYPLLLSPWTIWRYLRRPPRALRHMRERHRWTFRAQAPSLASQGDRSQPHATRLGTPVGWHASPKDVAHVETLCRRWGLERGSRQPLVIIAPGARSHIKRWSLEGFARVADRLIEAQGARIIFSGETDEEPLIEEVLGLMKHRAASAVGLTTIRQLGVLMAQARLVITNDSAALHLASLLNVPTVAVFGPTDETTYGPTASHHRVIRRRLVCSPCERSLCAFHHECMRFISPEDVYEAAQSLLAVSDATAD